MALELEEQYDKIYRHCYFKVKNKELAEDLTQETFLKYFSQTSYINRGKLLAYLYIIAKNLCMDYFRERKSLSVETEIFSKEEIALLDANLAIRTAINALTKNSQEILLLRFANDLGINQISTILGISRFTVYRRLNTAISQLKQHLKKEDFYE